MTVNLQRQIEKQEEKDRENRTFARLFQKHIPKKMPKNFDGNGHHFACCQTSVEEAAGKFSAGKNAEKLLHQKRLQEQQKKATDEAEAQMFQNLKKSRNVQKFMKIGSKKNQCSGKKISRASIT